MLRTTRIFVIHVLAHTWNNLAEKNWHCSMKRFWCFFLIQLKCYYAWLKYLIIWLESYVFSWYCVTRCYTPHQSRCINCPVCSGSVFTGSASSQRCQRPAGGVWHPNHLRWRLLTWAASTLMPEQGSKQIWFTPHVSKAERAKHSARRRSVIDLIICNILFF